MVSSYYTIAPPSLPVPQAFPHPPSDRHLGCFKALVTTNKSAMTIRANVFGHMLSFLGVEWLDHMVGVCLINKLPSCLPKWWHHFPPAPAAYQNSRLSPYLSKLGVVSGFNFSHPARGIVIFHSGLICISLITDNAENLLMWRFATYL